MEKNQLERGNQITQTLESLKRDLQTWKEAEEVNTLTLNAKREYNKNGQNIYTNVDNFPFAIMQPAMIDYFEKTIKLLETEFDNL